MTVSLSVIDQVPPGNSSAKVKLASLCIQARAGGEEGKGGVC